MAVVAMGVGALFALAGCGSSGRGATPTPDSGTTTPPRDAGAAAASDRTCLGILSCIAECPDGDDPCLEDCVNAGTDDAQAAIIALATCLDAASCTDLPCAEASCGAELSSCIDSGVMGSGSTNPGGMVPPGSIPGELVGTWARPGLTTHYLYTFGGDGSAAHASYRESSLGSCTIQADSQWSSGSAVASGDTLTITLAAGATAVNYVPASCGTAYTNPADPKIVRYRYMIDTSGSTPGMWVTDLDCTASCDDYLILQ